MDILPAADTLVDLFAGGCAITHAALESGKYRRVIANDLDPRGIDLFIGAIQGKYRDDYRWISREDFEELKDTDPYVALCWSFGNNGRNYLYNKDVEPYKKAVHTMLTAETVHDRRLAYKSVIRELRNLTGLHKQRFLQEQSLEALERVQSLERLEDLEGLERLESDYMNVEAPQGSIIYCDIPYKGTDDYSVPFDHEQFYSWACEQKHPTYISSYEIDDKRFTCIAEIPKRCKLSQTACNKVTERLYRPTNQLGGGA